MKTRVSNYLRRFAVLATAWREKYKSDLLFRSTVGVVVLLSCITIIYILLFSLLAFAEAPLWQIVIGIVATGGAFGFFLFRFMLLPTRNTLHYQKLFISNVAHELRTPLSTIKTSSEVALFDERLATPLRATFNEIVHELDRISEIVNNLLSLNNLTRPERIRFSNVDMAPLIDTVVARHSQLARERGIRLVVENDGYAVAWGNATALEQVITNVVKNALMYTPKNSKGIVTVSLRPDYQGAIIFAVTDNGIGIAQRDLAHVFEPFYRADMSRVRNIRSSGSGLGLAIVNEIVRAHHGKINIESAHNEGTVVSVMLPVGVVKEITPDIAHQGERKNHLSVDFSSGLSGMLPRLLGRVSRQNQDSYN